MLPDRLHQFAQHGNLVGAVGWCQIWGVGFDIAVDQIRDARRSHPGFPLAQRITAIVNHAAQRLGLFACGGDRPFRPPADGEAALPPFNTVIQREMPTAG